LRLTFTSFCAKQLNVPEETSSAQNVQNSPFIIRAIMSGTYQLSVLALEVFRGCQFEYIQNITQLVAGTYKGWLGYQLRSYDD
jgi:hypothetical protein